MVLAVVARITWSAGAALRGIVVGMAVVSAPALAGEPNGATYEAVLSADGRYVVFSSAASNFVKDDNNGREHDVFIRDRETGKTSLLSVSSAGEQGNRHSGNPSVSSDGLFVAFQSQADNLVAGDMNGEPDIFVHDRETGQTVRISTPGVHGETAGSIEPAISSDGCIVAFQSDALLAPDDTQFDATDIYVHDCRTDQRLRISVDDNGRPGNNESLAPAISADGRFVAFQSHASNLVSDDTNNFADVFVHDRDAGHTTRVSVDDAGHQGDRSSFAPSISADGRYVAFISGARNLVPGDTNGDDDVFVHDRSTGITTRISINSMGEQANDRTVFIRGGPYVSSGARFVAFSSLASNLVADDTNDAADVFVHDRQNGETHRLSVATTGVQTNSGAFDPSISADGRTVAFISAATNLTPGYTINTQADAFLRDRISMETTRIETIGDGTPLTSWLRTQGGVTASGNELIFDNDPRGWWSGAYSAALADLGFAQDNFEVRFTVGRYPEERTTWAVGLGTSETGTHWSDIEYGFRSIGGILDIRDNSAWHGAGNVLKFGDVLSIQASSNPNESLGYLEYRLNDTAIHQSTFPRSWHSEGFEAVSPLYVDTAFRDGFVSLAVTVVADEETSLPPMHALTGWFGHEGGVRTSGNQIHYDGSPTGWGGTVNSVALSMLGFHDYPVEGKTEPVSDIFEVHFKIDSDPQGSTWIVGLGSHESGARWSDIEFGLRADDGVLSVRENGAWRSGGSQLKVGDVISLLVIGSEKVIEYRHNRVPLFTTTYAGSPSFYVDTAFEEGAISLSTSVEGVPNDLGGGTALTAWPRAYGGVAANGNEIHYSGVPTGWENSIESAALLALGYDDDYELRFRIDSEPADTDWVIGLSTSEATADRTDVEFGLRSNNGVLNIREGGIWRASGATLAIDDVLSVLVSNDSIEYRHNGVPVYETSYPRSPDFYVDSAFRDGEMRLEVTVVDCDTPECVGW